VFGFVIFRAERFSDVGPIFEQIASAPAVAGLPSLDQLALIAGVGAFLLLSALDQRLGIAEWIGRNPSVNIAYYAVLVVLTLALGSDGARQFIYFQF
jgi:hypothetical protein